MKLAELTPGRRATIQLIEDEDLSVKLYEMGCLPGEVVVVENVAPFGDPMAIQVQGYKLCIRKSEAARITITPEDRAGN